MPTAGEWPPPAHRPAYDAFRAWSAWYSGDPDQLRDVYTRYLAEQQPRIRSSQYAGGIVGRFSRWLWGSPVPLAQRDPRLHVPLAGEIASASADLLFSEPPTLTADDTAVQERLDNLVDEGLHATLLEAGEVAAALGGVYLRPTIDPDTTPDRAFLTAVHADGALPVFRYGRLVEVTFWTTLLVDGQRHLRLLEHHEPGRVSYALHAGTEQQLGDAIPLAEHPEAARLADTVDEAGGQATGLKRLGVVYVPNMRPNRQWREIPQLRDLGRSDYAGSEGVLDKLDATWTSWMRDIHLGRGRIHVPEMYLQSNGPGQGASWDAEREVYAALNMLPKPGDGAMITVSQFAIRVQEHRETCEALVAEILRAAGYSGQTFGDQGDIAMTAAEVHSRERRSFITRRRKSMYWGVGLVDAVELLLALEAATFTGRPQPVRPAVEFGDSVSESPEAIARTLQLLAAAEAVSTDTRVRMLHPDWDDDQVAAEVARIRDEQGAGADPVDRLDRLTRGNVDQGDEGQGDDVDQPPPDDEQG